MAPALALHFYNGTTTSTFVKTVLQEDNGGCYVMDGDVTVAGPFPTNAAAWMWLDRNERGADIVRHPRSVRHGRRYPQKQIQRTARRMA